MPSLDPWLTDWSRRPGSLIVLAVVAALYLRGRRRIGTVARWRPFLFLAGLALLAVDLFSPLHHLAGVTFHFRSLQHLLLISTTPLLLVASDPVPLLVAGLPTPPRRWLYRAFAPGTMARRRLTAVTPAGVAFFVFMAVYWSWYAPVLHMAALRLPWLQTAEQFSLLMAASFYWWHILGVAPRLHRPLPPIVHILYTIAGAFPIKLLGLTLMFAPGPVYDYPGQTQTVGGIVVWLLGGLTFSWAALFYLRRWMSGEDDKPPLSHTAWATRERMLAPGIKPKR